MTSRIRPFERADCHRVLEICVAAFTPIHQGLEETLGSTIFNARYHDWKQQYADYLAKISDTGPAVRVYVVEEEGAPVAFVFTILDANRQIGEIGLNAVAPERQGQGIGKEMYEFALEDLKKRGAKVAYPGTGGDPAHAPARAAYQKVGFDRAIPGVYFFKTL
jgi:GNAT superfamily N-acetyltransferase